MVTNSQYLRFDWIKRINVAQLREISRQVLRIDLVLSTAHRIFTRYLNTTALGLSSI
jgi:hypothetical protein